MKDFVKMTLATLVGLLLFGFVSFLMSMAFFVSLASFAPAQETVLKENSVLRIKLGGVLSERSENADKASLFSSLDDTYVSPLGLDDLRAALNRAAGEKNIKALYLYCDGIAASPASVEELHHLIATFKERSGKPVYAYGDSYGRNTYWLASLADSLFVNPQGSVNIYGFAMQNMFFSRALEKLGVEMQIFKVGTFKSAVEPYILTKMSDANRLQTQRLADGLWSVFASDVCAARGIEPQVLERFVDEGGFMNEITAAQEAGLVDGVKYKQDMDGFFEKEIGKSYRFVSVSDMLSLPKAKKTKQERVAVLYAEGGIDQGGKDNMDSDDIVSELNKLADNNKVKAVVIRVNSPGGSAFGSEQMWYAARRLADKKPVVVSMSDYAASGGYYMSCMADAIVAQPATLTGSIGIFGMMPNVEGLMDKLGVDADGAGSHKFSDFGNTMRPMSHEEKALMQSNINRGYELFTSRCAEGRHMSQDSIKAIAEGRVWLGIDAVGNGLVDTLGGLDVAIAIAAKKAELGEEDYSVVEYPAKKDFMTELLESFKVGMTARAARGSLGEFGALYEEYNRVMNLRGAQALIPVYVEK